MAQGVSRTSYNYLNLPDTVFFRQTEDIAIFVYMADGRKIYSKYGRYNVGLTYQLNKPDATNDFLYMNEEIRFGDFELKDGKLTTLFIPGGYISTRDDATNQYCLKPRFYITDYQGSIRAICDGNNGDCLKSLEYLPSGIVFKETYMKNIENNIYKFCGKEEMTMHNYQMYDSKARFQHAKIPRFSTIDPLCEKYYSEKNDQI